MIGRTSVGRSISGLATLPFRDLMRAPRKSAGSNSNTPVRRTCAWRRRDLPGEERLFEDDSDAASDRNQCSALPMGRQRFRRAHASRATMTICFQPFDDQIMKPKLSIYSSDHVADASRWQPATRNNKSAIVDAALDRFLNPERIKAAMQPWSPRRLTA